MSTLKRYDDLCPLPMAQARRMHSLMMRNVQLQLERSYAFQCTVPFCHFGNANKFMLIRNILRGDRDRFTRLVHVVNTFTIHFTHQPVRHSFVIAISRGRIVTISCYNQCKLYESKPSRRQQQPLIDNQECMCNLRLSCSLPRARHTIHIDAKPTIAGNLGQSIK